MSKAKKMKIIDGKLTLVDIHDREEVIKVVNEVFDQLDDKTKENLELKRKLEKPTEDKLAEMKAELDMVKAELQKAHKNSLYILSEKDKETAHQFWLEHREVCPNKGRNMVYVVWGTGIGNCIEYGCRVCGDMVDLTDASIW